MSANSAPDWPAPAGSSTSARTPKKWSLSAPSPPAGCRSVEEGRLEILQEGKVKKFVDQVEHVTFSGPSPAKGPDRALYDRALCLFSDGRRHGTGRDRAGRRSGKGHPGQMDFQPVIDGTPRLMDARIFRPEPMGLKDDLLTDAAGRPLDLRSARKSVFRQFRRFAVNSRGDRRAYSQRRWNGSSRPSGTRCTPSSITTISLSCRNWWTNTPTWSKGWWTGITPASPATPPAPFCA